MSVREGLERSGSALVVQLNEREDMNAPANIAHETACDWRAVLAGTTPEALRLLADIAARDADDFAAVFYARLSTDPKAAPFLDSETVDDRLRLALRRWIVELLAETTLGRVEQTIEAQRRIGSLHSRVRVRMEHVLGGARLIKQALAGSLAASGVAIEIRAAAFEAGSTLIDLAMEAMAGEYSSARDTATRTDEAYRSFAATMNMALEREKQRAALVDWVNRFLRETMLTRSGGAPVAVGRSPFGLWIRHKAAALFSDGPELPEIIESMRRIDETLLPACTSTADAELRGGVAAVLAEVGHVTASLEAMFEHLVQMEAGRDVLTRLLNRRFLPTILSREIDLARAYGQSFAVLLVDVDHFKSINDRFGHPTGDRVLQTVAEVLSGTVRGGDFVFRYGGEEFLIVAVEVDEERARAIAEKLRAGVAAETIGLAGGGTLNTTISIGVAVHDGHPDFQRLVERADHALYRAKQAGRDTWIVEP